MFKDLNRQISGDEIRSVALGLLEDWESWSPDGAQVSLDIREEVGTRKAQFLLPLIFHTFRLGAVSTPLLDQGLILESTPLVRAMYEHGLMTLWGFHVPDGIGALVNSSSRKLIGLAKALDAMHLPANQAGTDTASQLEPRLVNMPTTSDSRYQQICDDFVGFGIDAYGHYRTLSTYTHPGIAIISRYVQSSKINAEVLNNRPNQEGEVHNWWLTAVSLLWAARVYDLLQVGTPRRDELRAHALILNVELDPKLTESAHQRLAAAHRANRS